MNLKELQKNWDGFGRTDPLWSILTTPDKKMNRWQEDEFFKTGIQEIETVMKYAESVSNFSHGRALDFGCGVGRLTQALANHFSEAYGVDIAPSMIERANGYNRCGENCRYFLNVSDDLKLFDDNSFDFIYSNIVLQHMKPEYSKNYIKEFIRILTPKGIAIFQIPSEKYLPLSEKYLPLSEKYLPLNQNMIIKSLSDSGFSAQIAVNDVPLSMEAGTQKNLYIKVKNVSSDTWPAIGNIDGKYQIKLGNHWLDKRDNIVINDDARTILPKDVGPMDDVDISLLVTAPQNPGYYILELDMVQEMVTWFKNKGSETKKFGINVRPNAINTNQNNIKEIVPRMEMYGVKRHEIIDLIKKNGGKLIDIQEDHYAKEWIGYRYCITKDEKLLSKLLKKLHYVSYKSCYEIKNYIDIADRKIKFINKTSQFNLSWESGLFIYM